MQKNKIKKIISKLTSSLKSHNVAIEVSQVRLLVLITFFILGYGLIAARLFDIVVLKSNSEKYVLNKEFDKNIFFHRNDIVDRNGVLLAVNLSTASLYANPKILLDPIEAAEKIHDIFPDLSFEELVDDFTSNKSFVWVKRNLTPKEQYLVNNLGLPGLFFERAEKRVYPHGPLLAHILGYVGLDGKGLAGIEKKFDSELVTDSSSNEIKENLQLSIDVRLQNIVREELLKAIDEFKAIGASGIIMDVNNGEILSMVSLPDFDPHHPGNAKEEQLFNRATLGVYEMGSSFKSITMAMALESGAVTLNDVYDVDTPIKSAKFSIRDYHAKGGWLSVPEIFMYSSNIGTAKISLDVGKKKQRKYLQDFGLLSHLDIEIPEKANPIYPQESRWSDLSTMTISYGHGIAVTPLHMIKAIASIVNGGILYKDTLIKHQPLQIVEGTKILKESTSKEMRKLFRLVVEHGTGKKANIDGYLVGGKTGTADKAEKGGYNRSSRLSSFVGAFPINNPQYIILVMLDDPKGNVSTGGYATAGMTAAPVVGNIISRMGPIYAIKPIKHNDPQVIKELYVDYKTDNDEDETL